MTFSKIRFVHISLSNQSSVLLYALQALFSIQSSWSAWLHFTDMLGEVMNACLCAMFAACPFGDHESWCSGIGHRYSVSSCYDHETKCCDTCSRFKTTIPGKNPHVYTECSHFSFLWLCIEVIFKRITSLNDHWFFTATTCTKIANIINYWWSMDRF